MSFIEATRPYFRRPLKKTEEPDWFWMRCLTCLVYFFREIPLSIAEIHTFVYTDLELDGAIVVPNSAPQEQGQSCENSFAEVAKFMLFVPFHLTAVAESKF